MASTMAVRGLGFSSPHASSAMPASSATAASAARARCRTPGRRAGSIANPASGRGRRCHHEGSAGTASSVRTRCVPMSRMVCMMSARPRTGMRQCGVLAAGRRPEQPEQHQRIEQCVENDAVGRTERQHDDAATAGPTGCPDSAPSRSAAPRSADGRTRCRTATPGSASAIARRRSHG